MAAFESVPGDKKSCLFSPPKLDAATLIATRMRIHAATTTRRCWKDQEVMRFNMVGLLSDVGASGSARRPNGEVRR